MQQKITGNVLIVAGPRDYNDKAVITDALVDAIIDFSPVLIISGDATGVDSIVADMCSRVGRPYQMFRAEWNKYGKSAGPIRNVEMARNGTHLLAFYNGSPGTSNMIYFAEKFHLKIRKIDIL